MDTQDIDEYSDALLKKVGFLQSFESYFKKHLTLEQIAFERGRLYAFTEALNLLDGKERALFYPYQDGEDEDV